MIPLIDQYCWTPHRKILSSEQTQLPWLQTFGIQTSGKAEKPLVPHTLHGNCFFAQGLPNLRNLRASFPAYRL